MQEKTQRRSNRERSEAMRASLIAAARSLFVEKGYAETGTPEIVARAKVTRGALYHHFTDKADLFRTVVEQEARNVAREIESETANPASPIDALLTGADIYFAAMTVPGRVRLLLLDGPSVLGHAEMDRIDGETGREELRQGLAHAMAEAGHVNIPFDALADLLSVAFDRAALAIAAGKPEDDYKAAISLILSRLLGPAPN